MKFLFKGYVLLILLVCLTIVSLFVGVSQLSLSDIFHLSEEQQNILFSSRIPRTVSILLSGSSLALAGLIMQQMMQNKFVSPTTAGTMEWAKLGILISLIFFPKGHILIKYDYFISPSLLSQLMGGMNETNIFILGLPSGGDQEREILPSKLEGGILLEKSITSPREHSQQQIRLCGRVAP